MPRFSVIIPAYNSERYLERCITSALSQSTKDLEVVVVNDGSSDSTRAVAEAFLPKIVLLNQENKGPAAARNLGIRASSGGLVAFLDADDWWKPHRLEKMGSVLDASPDVGFITSDAYLVQDDQVTERTYYQSLPPRQKFHQERQGFWIARTDFIFTGTVVRRQLFESHGHFDENLRGPEDWALWMRFIAGGERAGFVDEPLAYYRVRSGSLSNSRVGMMGAESQLYEKALSEPRTRKLPGIEGMAQYAWGRAALLSGKPREARKHFFAASRDPQLTASERSKAAVVGLAPGPSRGAYRALLKLRRQL